MWPIAIPAGCTHLLQPLDTHVFLSFKRRLEQIHQDAQVRAGCGDVEFTDFAECIRAAVEDVISCQSWVHAFEHDGFGCLQAGLSDRVRVELAIDSSATCTAERPTLEQIACCFPRRFRLTSEIAFGPDGRVAVATPLLLRAAIPTETPARIVRRAPIN